MTNDDIHTPVLLDRCVELLAPALQREGAVVVDATEGMGGHSEALLEKFPDVRLVGLDRDTDALRIAGERLARFGDRVDLVHTVYDGIREALDSLGIRRVDGILFDLGVSSLQLDEADRGFAYAQDAPLDMRMDQTAGTTAAEILATYSEGNLRRIFERYGEEKLAGRYARAIIEARGRAPLTRSGELVDVLIAATPMAVQRDRSGHPAKRVFQALRIEVNAELAVLERALPAALDALAVGGRIVVMSYQSLEDRAVKRVLAEASSSTAPSGLPVELPEHAPRFRLLVRGAELASEEERERNPRATPVRLRAAERMREAS
ncbi:16S rRNA (cytosine(1402)-N(4))-methyltransferase RsmH [Microbacterium arborescens]|jgi:16S rRNA (cytosine1402-N4)-methyltransferase|uniref:16S rRNA (cytosine(1402)-N(4))-methyltransferase RsmH n=1 Tax=Microbacterium TaxID=33882 RepID=UPI0025A1A2B5|nr:16S rRNA (cytosine(1402)-N(4))-methyltransferase RsmH [Microbacterium arborescens]MDF2579966.1 rRNA ((1402)-N(4))-methyltransferase [Microbacterium sp.]WJM17267.1 16S rRNA (cytosine(1402)-N(4))-methyltransferase RsmH [Microbacterium arborescens]